VSSSSCSGNFNSSKEDKLKKLSFNEGNYDVVKKNTRLRNMKMKKSETRIPEFSNGNSLKYPVLDSYNYCSTTDSAVYCENSFEKYKRSNDTLKEVLSEV
jgi:hypothetical protein